MKTSVLPPEFSAYRTRARYRMGSGFATTGTTIRAEACDLGCLGNAVTAVGALQAENMPHAKLVQHGMPLPPCPRTWFVSLGGANTNQLALAEAAGMAVQSQ